MEITTICRKDKINKHNEVSIAIRIYHNREDKRLSTGLKINADDWDFEHNCLKSDAWNREHIQFILNEKIQAITRKALELFLFSYLTAGINFKDIATLRYQDIENGRIYYTRHKTQKMMTFQLLPEALSIEL